jgi:membrane-associated phospholipid phosphatase
MGSSWKAMVDDNRRQMLLLLKDGVKTPTEIVAIATFVIAAGVILSTLFIKQHYVVDEIAGITLAWGVGRPLFNRLWKPFKATQPPAKPRRKK